MYAMHSVKPSKLIVGTQFNSAVRSSSWNFHAIAELLYTCSRIYFV